MPAVITNPTGPKRIQRGPKSAPSPRELGDSIAFGRNAFARVLSQPCAAHGAEPGTPCWPVVRGHAALCGSRIRRAGFHRQPSPGAMGIRERGPR